MSLTAKKPFAAPAGQGHTQGKDTPGTQTRRLKKGMLVFSEGENSRAMYFIKSGIVRIFKKKGNAQIEIDTVHSGQILGELAFLDGNPRSASGEALTECELVEISGPTFTGVIQTMPDWLKILLKTVVSRLRTASTRIRQLESASSSYDYSEKDGRRTSNYVYMSVIDVMKLASAVLLVASRYGNPVSKAYEIRMSLLQRYANQIMGIPLAKITTFLDLLSQIGVLSTSDETGGEAVLTDIDFLEKIISYLNEENLLDTSKKHDLSLRGFMLMGMIAKHLAKAAKDEATGTAVINLAQIRKLEVMSSGKEPFRMDDFPELVKLGYATPINLKSSEEMFTVVKPDEFLHSYRMQRVVMTINSINEQKQKGGR